MLTWQLHDACLCCNAAHEAVPLCQVARMVVSVSSQPTLILHILWSSSLSFA